MQSRLGDFQHTRGAHHDYVGHLGAAEDDVLRLRLVGRPVDGFTGMRVQRLLALTGELHGALRQAELHLVVPFVCSGHRVGVVVVENARCALLNPRGDTT